MKSIVLIALLGNLQAVQISQRTQNKIYSRFIEGNFDTIDDDGNSYIKQAPKPRRKFKKGLRNHLHLNLKADINQGSGLASDPIWGSLGPDEKTDEDFQTEEGIIERDLRSRKPVKFTLDPDEHPDTQESIEWAEKQLGAKLTPPKRTAFEIEMDKLDDDHQFNYETEQDSDITDTLANAKLAEKQVNQRSYGYGGWGGYGGHSNYGYGGYGYGGWGYEEPKDWWTGLVKDNGKEGMISTTARAKKRNGYYGGSSWKNYDELAGQYVKEREEKIAREKAAKMPKADKEAAKELSKATEGDDDDKKEDDKKDEGEGKKEEKKKLSEVTSEDQPPESAKPKGLAQRSHRKSSRRAKKEQDDETFSKNDAGKDVIDIGGEKIILGPLGEEDLQVTEDLRSQDLVEYLQTEDLETGDFVALQLSNQEKLERLIRYVEVSGL